MINNIVIRTANKKDNNNIVKLLTDVLHEFGMKLDSIYDNDIEDMRSYYGGKNDLFLVAEVDDCIVGICGIKELEKGAGEVRKLYVLSDYRGLGLGARLFDKILSFAKEHQYVKLILATDAQFIRAIKLYSSRGFKIVKEEENIYMEKVL